MRIQTRQYSLCVFAAHALRIVARPGCPRGLSRRPELEDRRHGGGGDGGDGIGGAQFVQRLMGEMRVKSGGGEKIRAGARATVLFVRVTKVVDCFGRLGLHRVVLREGAVAFCVGNEGIHELRAV